MGGHDSQKLLPRRGSYSSPGRSKPPAYRTNTLTDHSLSRLQTSQAGSATHRVGHFWKAQVGNFSKAPKSCVVDADIDTNDHAERDPQNGQ
jgi:hypothetical protein